MRCRRAPAGLEEVVIGRAHSQAGAAHRSNKWARCRPVWRCVTDYKRLIAVVTGREIDADALDGALENGLLIGEDITGGQQFGGETVGVSHDLGQASIDHVIEGGVEVLEVVRRTDENDI